MTASRASRVIPLVVLWAVVVWVGWSFSLTVAADVQSWGIERLASKSEADLRGEYEEKYYERYGEYPEEGEMSLGVYNDIYVFPIYGYAYVLPLLSLAIIFVAVCGLAYFTAHLPLSTYLKEEAR